MKVDQEILDRCGGDMAVYNNWVIFADFMCDMVQKYGKQVLEKVEEKERLEAEKEKAEKEHVGKVDEKTDKSKRETKTETVKKEEKQIELEEEGPER